MNGQKTVSLGSRLSLSIRLAELGSLEAFHYSSNNNKEICCSGCCAFSFLSLFLSLFPSPPSLLSMCVLSLCMCVSPLCVCVVCCECCVLCVVCCVLLSVHPTFP